MRKKITRKDSDNQIVQQQMKEADISGYTSQSQKLAKENSDKELLKRKNMPLK